MISRRAKEIHPSIHLRLATSIRSRRPRLLVYRTGLFWGRFIASPFFFFFIFNSHGVVDLANFECRYNCCPHLYIFWYTFWLACLERWWSPRDPVLLIFIFRLYLEEYCILNSGGHFGLAFTSLKTLTRFRVCNFPVWHLPYRFLSLYKLLLLSRELYRWHQAILTTDTKTRMQQSDTLFKREPWLKMAVKNLTQRILILRWMQLYRKSLCIVSGSFLLIRRKVTWCKP